MRKILVHGMQGLGDNLMQRPFVRLLSQRQTSVFLITPWPEFYKDLDVAVVKPNSRLRTQRKHEDRYRGKWSDMPRSALPVRIGYGMRSLAAGSIYQAIEQVVPLGNRGKGFSLDLPDMGDPWPVQTGGKPLAVVRPVTVRLEWNNTARSPKPEYVAWVAGKLMETHHVVCVADCADGKEWVLGDLPPCHESYLHGEIGVLELLEMLRRADIVVGGVGWIVPASLALGIRCFCLLGGCGGHNAPEKITDPRLDLSRLAFATPDRFCCCPHMQHDCDKTNTNLEAQWDSAVATWSAVPARMATA